MIGEYKIKRIIHPKHPLFGKWVVYKMVDGEDQLVFATDDIEIARQKKMELSTHRPDDRVKRFLEGR